MVVIIDMMAREGLAEKMDIQIKVWRLRDKAMAISERTF